ncbi:MAG TPA: tripartite tricarboxylate transporter TctB family protein [Burkholderiaceae bacterium]|nr:tripartite tricarboxylate transporter TctB family protein [Burkholderiaceae bacterium]
MQIRPNVVVGIAVLLAAAFFGAGLTSIDDQGGYSGLSPRFLPMLVTIGLAVCGLLLLTRPASVPAQAEDSGGRPVRLSGLGGLLAGVVVVLALIGSLGFVLASCVLMVCVARGYGSRRPLRDALVALLLTLPVWALFSKVLGLSLPLLPVLGIQ